MDDITKIINEEISEFVEERVDDTSNVLDEILTELWDLNHGISYIPQGYKHNILDED